MRRHAFRLRGPVAATLLATVPLALGAPAQAACRMNVADFVGWQIIYAGEVAGTIDPNGRSESFGGCAPGRVLLIDEDRSVVCTRARLGAAYRIRNVCALIAPRCEAAQMRARTLLRAQSARCVHGALDAVRGAPRPGRAIAR